MTGMEESNSSADFRSYVALLRQWLWFLTLCTVIGASGAFGVARLQTPMYLATTVLIVNAGSSSQDVYSNVLASDQVVQTYVNLVTQPDVVSAVASQIHGITPAELASEISASSQSGTQLITIQVDDPSPARATALANATAATFIAVQQRTAQKQLTDKESQTSASLAHIQQQIGSLTAQINSIRTANPNDNRLGRLEQQLSAAQAQQSALQSTLAQLSLDATTAGTNIYVVQTATQPSTPDHPKPLLYAMLGAVLGLAVALGVVLLGRLFDDRVRTDEDVEMLTGLPTLAKVYAAHTTHGVLSLLNSTGYSHLAEDLRVLRTNLSFLSPDRPLMRIAVTSAIPGEGKSTVAVNLAFSLAQAGKRVLLVDADLRRPSVHKILGITNAHGLSDGLAKYRADLTVSHAFTLQAIANVPNLFVVTAGPLPPNPTELLGSQAMECFLEAVVGDHGETGVVDVVVLDCAPALACADAEVVAAHADATILVADTSRARNRQVLSAINALAHVKANVVGVVLNRVVSRERDTYTYHYEPEGSEAKETVRSVETYLRALLRLVPSRAPKTPEA